jgi:hypothetical protein
LNIPHFLADYTTAFIKSIPTVVATLGLEAYGSYGSAEKCPIPISHIAHGFNLGPSGVILIEIPNFSFIRSPKIA